MSRVIGVSLPEIEGYEYTGEFRCPKTNEYFLSKGGDHCIVERAQYNYSIVNCLILKKEPIERYVTITFEEAKTISYPIYVFNSDTVSFNKVSSCGFRYGGLQYFRKFFEGPEENE